MLSELRAGVAMMEFIRLIIGGVGTSSRASRGGPKIKNISGITPGVGGAEKKNSKIESHK